MKSYTGFSPYRGNNVAPEWCNLDLSRFGLGWVYALAEKATAEERKWIGEECMVSLLGHGPCPFIPWSKLTTEEQRELLAKIEVEEEGKYG